MEMSVLLFFQQDLQMRIELSENSYSNLGYTYLLNMFLTVLNALLASMFIYFRQKYIYYWREKPSVAVGLRITLHNQK
jgi:hypothetical protein